MCNSFNLNSVRNILNIVLVHLFIVSAVAQTETLIEILSDVEDEQNNLNEWIAILQENPIDINNETAERLKDIPFLNKTHIDTILTQRPFKRKSQVRLLLGDEVYQHIRTLIVIKKTLFFPQIAVTQRFRYSLVPNRGFSQKIFLGTAYESLSRIRIKPSRYLSAGILIQKDSGESKYYDHFSGFFSWHPSSLPLKIILGNFYIQCAEGLLLAGPYSLPKTAMAKSPHVYRSLSLKSYLSSNEYDGFWGASIRWGTDKGFKVGAFYSQIYRDAIRKDNSTYILRLDRSGYHRTVPEMYNQNSVLENSMGAILHLPVLIFSQFGVAYIKTDFQPGFLHFQPEDRRRDFYKFQGSGIDNYSIFYSSRIGPLQLHGEVVPLSWNSLAQRHSFDLHIQRWGFTFLWSHFPSQFQSPFGRSFSDSSPFPRSVQQLYMGISGKPVENLRLTGYWYIEKELWRSYFQSLPQIKKTGLFQSEYYLYPKIQMLLRYQCSSSSDNSPDLLSSVNKVSHRYRLQVEKKISTQVRIRSRFEQSIINYSGIYPKKVGTNFFQNLYWVPQKYLRIQLQFSSFNTVDYEARIYEYESDLPGVFSNFPLFGSGNKWYALLTVMPLKNLKIWLKYRKIYFDGVDHIGSGLSMIEGNTRQDVHFQIEYRY